MKNLDLNGLSVQEMNAGEMRIVEGGFFSFGPWGIGIQFARIGFATYGNMTRVEA